jgi:DMSO reductase anchor subunit
MPAADKTVSTTRITVPEDLPFELKKADYDRVRPEHAHGPLVAMTVLTQMAVGAFAAIWLRSLIRAGGSPPYGAAIAFAIAVLALGASTFHLGRPVHAYRALRMWRRSWLSREVLAFSLFAGVAFAYAAALWMRIPAATLLGGTTVLFGIAGITSSAFIYLVPARPAWNSKHTVSEFFLTAAILGSLFGSITTIAATAAGLQLLNQAVKFLWLTRSDEFELRASARLLSHDLHTAFLLRFALLITGGIVLPLTGWPVLALAIATAGEMLGRYLFFVSVVPRNIAASFFSRKAA